MRYSSYPSPVPDPELPPNLEYDLPPQEENEISEWRQYIEYLRENLWLIILIFLAAVTIAVVYGMRATPIYRSTAVLLIEQQQANVVKVDAVDQMDLRTVEMMKTVVATIKSRVIYERVIENLALEQNPYFNAPDANGKKPTKLEMAQRVGNLIQVNLRPQTRLVDISAEHADPEMAKNLADAVAREFIRFGLEQRTSTTRTAHQFLFEEADRLRENVRKSEQALQEYRITNNAASLEDNQNLVIAQLKTFNEQRNTAQAERVRLESDHAKVKEMQGNLEELLRIPSVAELNSVAEIARAVAQKEAEFAVIQQRYKHKHPRYIAAETEINHLRAKLGEVVANAGSLVESAYRAAKETEEKLSVVVTNQEKKAMELDQKAIGYNALKRDLETDRTIYESVLSRMKETDLTQGLDQSLVRLLEPATAGTFPVRPQKLLITSGAALGGLLLGAFIAIVLGKLHTGLRTVDEAEQHLGLPVLGAVPERELKKGENELATLKENHSAVTEAFRSFRAGIYLLGPEVERRTLLITSALPGEGKTFVSCSTAIVLAQAGLKTLLIDADLRKPRVSKTVFGKVVKPGLADVLLGNTKLSDALHQGPEEKLWVLPAGTHIPNPSELLTEAGMQRLVEEALKDFDRVVIDTAPILAVSDTLTIARVAQTVCVAVRAGKTPRQASQRACRLLAEIGCRPSGIVLNRISVRSGGYYYYYGHYGSKEVYGRPRSGEES